MSNIKKTISYLKRNGITDTVYAVRERIDKKHIDEMSRLMIEYKGREALSQTEQFNQEEYQFRRKYFFSILVPAYETNEAYLKEMIDSVLTQTYGRLELIIADASASDCVQKVVEIYDDDRIIYTRIAENNGISANTNEALKLAKGDYIGLLDHDDVLTKDALYEVMKVLQERDYAFVYTDEDKTNGDMTRFYEPHYKPEFNLDLILSNNYICHFLVMKKELLQSLSFRTEFDGAQDYDLVLRAVRQLIAQYAKENDGDDSALQYIHVMLRNKIAHVPKILYHWRCHENSTASNPESKNYAYEAGLSAVEDFITSMQWEAHAEHSKHKGFYRIIYHKSIWEVRHDVAAVGGNIVKRGIIIGSVELSGRPAFVGMNRKYSGYMHRASMYFDADSLDSRCVTVRTGLPVSMKEARELGMCLLYDPEYVKGII